MVIPSTKTLLAKQLALVISETVAPERNESPVNVSVAVTSYATQSAGASAHCTLGGTGEVVEVGVAVTMVAKMVVVGVAVAGTGSITSAWAGDGVAVTPAAEVDSEPAVLDASKIILAVVSCRGKGSFCARKTPRKTVLVTANAIANATHSLSVKKGVSRRIKLYQFS